MFLLALLAGAGCSGDDSPMVMTDAGRIFEDAGIDAAIEPDAGSTPDAGSPDAGSPPPMPPYERLSETGLYTDIGQKLLDPEAQLYRPNDLLWSDDSLKRRWVFLPEGEQIDTSDMDRWEFPVGTRVFKEFSRHGMRLETRLIQRVDDSGGDEDYWMGSFVWLADGTDAVFAEDGATDVLGTTHDVPNTMQCLECHQGEPGRMLGLSALQSSGPNSVMTLDEWVADGRLTHPPAGGEVFSVPGDSEIAAAFGYLHVNCGTCHNENGVAWSESTISLRLSVDDRTPEETAIYQTTVGVELDSWREPMFTERVVPGSPEMSALLFRMTVRGDPRQMPPLGTEDVDFGGVAAVRRWIESL